MKELVFSDSTRVWSEFEVWISSFFKHWLALYEVFTSFFKYIGEINGFNLEINKKYGNIIVENKGLCS